MDYDLKPILNSYSVDASCFSNPGPVEYRCVHTETKADLFRSPRWPRGTNNLGEFLALVNAIYILSKKGIYLPIYSDSNTAIAWVKRNSVNSNLERDGQTAPMLDRVESAIAYLQSTTVKHQILKWETRLWGNIPADYGRKFTYSRTDSQFRWTEK